MKLDLSARSALIFGASGGLGRAVAVELASHGAHVTVVGRRAEELETLRSQIVAEGGEVRGVVVGDVTKVEDIEEAVSVAAGAEESIDVVFNNGGGPKPGRFDELGDQDWSDAFELTFLSYVRAVRASLPYLRNAGGGWIMNNTTSGVKANLDLLLLSNSFRMAVVGLSKTLSIELAPDNILVNTAAPGRIATDRVGHMDKVRAEGQGVSIDEVRAAAETRIPLGRYGSAEEFARVVAFHCSPANTYVTGQVLVVDGGMVRGY